MTCDLKANKPPPPREITNPQLKAINSEQNSDLSPMRFIMALQCSGFGVGDFHRAVLGVCLMDCRGL